jgi:hypothetical protein
MTVMPLSSSQKDQTASSRETTHASPSPASSLAQRNDPAASQASTGTPPLSGMSALPVRSVTP